MDPVDSKLVWLACGSSEAHGSPVIPEVRVPPRPGKADVDPLLAAPALTRLVVAGTDADLAAVLTRLLRRERLDVEVAYVPDGRGRSAAARCWGLPGGGGYVLDAPAVPVPLVRDDSGGVLAGRAEIPRLRGECYADETLVLRGRGHLVVEAGPRGVGVRASRTGRGPDGRVREVSQSARAGRGSATGARAVQVGGAEFIPLLDGIPHPRPVHRWAWYRHTTAWLLVRP